MEPPLEADETPAVLSEERAWFCGTFPAEMMKHLNTQTPEAAFGLKAHSGWAALVVLGMYEGKLQVIERTRLTLVDDDWAKQPYHAAEVLQPAEAKKLVKRGVDAAKRGALREVRAAIKRIRQRGFEPRACGVLMGEPMPDWSVAEILAVHFRMHKAEGVLFRQVLADAAEASDLKLIAIPEKRLPEEAAERLQMRSSALLQQIAGLGKQIGTPWAKDQKDAALAALIALRALKTK
jgi:hypothetical protein